MISISVLPLFRSRSSIRAVSICGGAIYIPNGNRRSSFFQPTRSGLLLPGLLSSLGVELLRCSQSNRNREKQCVEEKVQRNQVCGRGEEHRHRQVDTQRRQQNRKPKMWLPCALSYSRVS